MAFENNIKGLNKVLKNLNKRVDEIEGKTLKGLVRGALVVMRSVELNPPLTPVDLGNLRASRFVATSKGGIYMGRNPKFVKGGKKGVVGKLTAGHGSVITEAKTRAARTGKPTVLFGFSAYYAAPVHEMTGSINWSRSGSGAKFFEKSIYKNRKNILLKIMKEVKIKR